MVVVVFFLVIPAKPVPLLFGSLTPPGPCFRRDDGLWSAAQFRKFYLESLGRLINGIKA
jgi:hypothetical protein